MWPLVVADLHERYGVDVTAPAADCDALTGRSWPWLQARIRGLLVPGTRTHAATAPPPPPGQGAPRPRRR